MVNKNQSKRSAGRKKLLLGILERHRTLQCKIWRQLERLRLRTVDTHLERARHKCGAHSNEEFTREVPLLN